MIAAIKNKLKCIKPFVSEKTRFSFHSPKKADVLIWDATNSDFLSNYVLQGLNHSVLHTRGELYHISPRIIGLIINHYLKRFLFQKNNNDNYGLLQAYQIVCLTCICPRVVLTFIDNNPTFHWLSHQYPDASFFAIQNGVRVINDSIDYSLQDLKEMYLEKAELYSVSDFICFGECESDFYRKYGSKIERYHPVGALKGSWFKYEWSKITPKEEYILCFVSQYRTSMYNENKHPNFFFSLKTIEDYILKFVMETGYTLSIATASNSQEEYEYYSKKFADLALIISNNRADFTTYQVMNKSRVIISFYSTAALEAFGWGKKVLFCNYSGDSKRSSRFSDICSTDTAEYEIFKRKLLHLIEMGEREYFRLTESARRHHMNYDPKNSATSYVRKIVEEKIA